MKSFLIGLLDWIYKKKCYFCKKSKENLKMCSLCFEELEHTHSSANRIILGKNIYCAGIYSQTLQKLIRGVKYHNQKELAYYQAKFMYDYWKNLEITGDFQVVPVPLHEKRKKQRKYNHMELVAEEFCKLSGYTINSDLIKRVKDTKVQYKLNRIQRMENLSGAFSVDKKHIKHGKVLVLDDICTTGSTFENIIQELSKNNINDIVCFATATPEI